MKELSSISDFAEIWAALRDSGTARENESQRRRPFLEFLAALVIQDREGLELDEALERIGQKLDIDCVLTHPQNESLKDRLTAAASTLVISKEAVKDFWRRESQTLDLGGAPYVPDWLVESLTSLADPAGPVLFLNWSASTFMPRFMAHTTRPTSREIDFVTVDRDPRVVEDLRLMVSLVVDDLDQVRESIRLHQGEDRSFEKWEVGDRLNLFDTFESGKQSQNLYTMLNAELEPHKFGTAFVSIQGPAFQNPRFYAELSQTLPAILSEILAADGRAVILSLPSLLHGNAWSKLRTSLREHLHVESVVDFSGIEVASEESWGPIPALVLLRQPQHAITRQVTIFGPTKPGSDFAEPAELLDTVIASLGSEGGSREAVAFERPTSELNDRWDPKFYCPARRALQDRLISSPHATWLGGVTEFIKRGVPPSVLAPFIRTEIAGITAEEGQKATTNLRVGDRVWLRSEPDNPDFPHLVQVERRSGTYLGFLPFEFAAVIVESLQALGGKHPALVTELRSGAHDPFPRVTIQFAPPEHALTGEAVKLIRPKDIVNNRLVGRGETAWLLPEAQESVTRVRAGDILLLLRGYGKACAITREFDGAVCHQDLAIIRPSDDVDPLYLLSFTLSADFQEQLHFVARGEALPSIDLQDLSDLLVILPPLPAQRRVALAFAESQGELGPTSGESLVRWLEFAAAEENRDQAWVLSSLLSSLFSDLERIESLEDWLQLKGQIVQQLRNAAQGHAPFPDAAIQHLILGLARFGELIERVDRNPYQWATVQDDARGLLASLEISTFQVSDEGLQRRMVAIVDRLDELVESRAAPSRVQIRLEPMTIYAGTASRVLLSVKNATQTPMEIVQFQTYAPGAPGNADPEQILHPRAWLLPGESFTLERVVQIDRVGRASLDCEVLYDQGNLPNGPYWELATFELEVIPGAPVAYIPIQPNPYIAGGAVDSPEMFFGRQDVLDFLRDNLIGKHQANVIILQGNRRTGKSSILKQVVNLDIFAPHIAVYIDCQGLGTLTDRSFFYKIARLVWKTMASREDSDKPSPVSRGEISEEDAFYDFQEVLDRLVGMIPGRRIILLIDEFEVIDLAIQTKQLSPLVLENLRHLFQHRHDLAIVLTGSYRLSRLGQEYWSILFGLGLKREVGFLDESAVHQLITEPLTGLVNYSEEAIGRIIQLTACQPYFVQMVCHDLVNVLNGHEAAYVTNSYVEEAALETLVSADGHMRFMFESAGSSTLKAVLVYLASSLAQPGNVSNHEIERFVKEYGLFLTSAELEEGLRQMADRDIVQIEGTMEQRRYGFKIDLVRQWIRRNYDLRSAIALAQDASYIRED